MTVMPSQPPSRDAAFASNRRQVIDMVATLRARAIRVSLLGRVMLLPGPNPDAGPMPTHALAEQFREQLDAINRALHCLEGHDPHGAIPPGILSWLNTLAKKDGQVIFTVKRLLQLSEKMAAAAKDNDAPGQNDDLLRVWADHNAFGLGGFFQAITTFCDDLWEDVETSRRDENEQADIASAHVNDTLTKLERIGKHVKLVSLNATVEASRAGEEGKGLAVIAFEFKTLAEEIQSLAASARAVRTNA